MADAFARVINHHRKAVIIGSDCPGLTTLIINDAFAVLETNDIVLGPANDGGYYLLGCKKVYPALFEGIAWSTPYVLGQTIEKIENENLSYRLLDHLTDIDTLQDWLRYKDQSNVTDGI
jgi:rSAM/selenodomain-associated transferase 1